MKFAASLLAVIGVAQANFRSGSVSTFEKFQYGKFVTRMKAPDRKGTVSSFFTYWDGPNFSTENWNELDMEIVPSVSENPFSMNIIYGDGSDKVESHDYAHGFNPHDEWHVYEMEWTPHYVSWSVDGHEMRHVSTQDPALEHLQKAQSLRMNFWTPTFHSWGEGLNPVDMPWYLLYDYVEVFTYDQHDNEFKFHWRDDFDHFDSAKWHKASGGFESNTSTFHPANVYTSGGHLVLKMEPEHSDHEELVIEHDLVDSFGLDLDHRQVHESRARHFERFNDVSGSDSSSDFYSDSEEEYRHHEKQFVDHHDKLYRGEHGEYILDHQDVLGDDHRDDWSKRHMTKKERMQYEEKDRHPYHHVDYFYPGDHHEHAARTAPHFESHAESYE